MAAEDNIRDFALERSNRLGDKLDRLLAAQDTTNQRLSSLEIYGAGAGNRGRSQRIDGVQRRLDGIGARLDRIERRLDLVETPAAG
jgi:hypothetical protein